jgi:hypothetical protein
MEKHNFTEGIGLISKFFGATWPNETLAAAYEQVSSEAVEALMLAHKRICLDFSPKPQPPMARIVAIIKEEGNKRRMQAGVDIEDAWNKQKRGTGADARAFFNKEKSDKHARQAIKMINNRLEGKLNDEDYQKCLGQMAKDYPCLGDGTPHGIGWEELLRIEQLKAPREALRMAA